MRFSFTLWDKGLSYIDIPTVSWGIDTSQYLPQIIYTKNSESSFIAQSFQGMRSVSDPQEVQNDLDYMLEFINNNRINLITQYSYISVVENSVWRHIGTYGRVFFTDLISYVDLAAHLMVLYDFNGCEIRNTYIRIIFEIVKKYGDLIKEGHPALGIIPFSSTQIYKNIEELIQETKS